MFCGFLLLLFVFIYNRNNHLKPSKRRKANPDICILIPARDESKVIRGLLDSLTKQTYPVKMEDVYIIVEDMNDLTVDIAKEFGANIFLRKDLSKKRKGYALDEAVKMLLEEQKSYDVYFIFDADNILCDNYMEEMIASYQEGYDVGTSYRNCKNGNASCVASASVLTFSLINTIMNDAKNRSHANVLITGAGSFIDHKWIEKWKGFPFNTLTEDYELTLYTILHSIPTTFNRNACFYDEQPKSFSQSVVQRTRWIRGFLDARREYIPKIRKNIRKKDVNKGSKVTEVIGIIPYVFLVVGAILYMVVNIIGGFLVEWDFFLRALQMLFGIYILLVIVTIGIFVIDNRLQMNFSSKIKVSFYHPLFLASYIICALKAIFQKEKIGWARIEHDETHVK